MYRKLVLLGIIIGCLSLLGVTMMTTTAYSNVNSSQSGVPSFGGAQTDTVTSSSLGLPGIPVKNVSTDASNAAFTSSDVFVYVSAHSMPSALPSGQKPVITKILFLTSQKVSTLLKGESIGVPDGTLLCYVELQGTFAFANPSGGSVTYRTGVEVFDAHTGHLLMAGGQ